MTADEPHCLCVRVYWEDTDASGVVYHAAYLRWAERARTEWLRSRGHDQQLLLREARIAFTVASLEIGYRRPARLDDELTVDTRIAERRRASLCFAQSIRRGAELLCALRVRVACVDTADFSPRRLPAIF